MCHSICTLWHVQHTHARSHQHPYIRAQFKLHAATRCERVRECESKVSNFQVWQCHRNVGNSSLEHRANGKYRHQNLSVRFRQITAHAHIKRSGYRRSAPEKAINWRNSNRVFHSCVHICTLQLRARAICLKIKNHPLPTPALPPPRCCASNHSPCPLRSVSAIIPFHTQSPTLRELRPNKTAN